MRLIKGIHRTSTWLVLAIGVTHTLGTFFFFENLSEAAIWFSGAGLAGIFVAFLNIFLWQRGCPPLSRKLTSVANVLFIAWLAIGFVATPALPSAIVLTIGGMMALGGITIVLLEAGAKTGGRAT